MRGKVECSGGRKETNIEKLLEVMERMAEVLDIIAAKVDRVEAVLAEWDEPDDDDTESFSIEDLADN